MKKYLIPIMSICLLSLAACTKSDISQGNEPEKTGEASLVFVGGAPSTRVSMGEKTTDANGAYYPGVWENGDAIDILDAGSGTSLGTAAFSGLNDSGKGLFNYSGDSFAAGTTLRVIYPSGASLEIPSDQTQAAAGASSIGKYSYAWSKGDIEYENTGDPVPFSLSYANAIVKVSLKVSESDADGLSSLPLKSVMLYSKGAKLSGSFSLDYATGAVTPDATQDYVKVALDAPAALSGTQEVWMTALPVSSATDFYVVVELGNDAKTVTIPVLFKGKTLAAGRVAAIKIENLSLASNACKWYEPVETRLLAGGYAYGEANTYVVKETVVSGALDVKARGDFRKVSEPKYLALWFTHFNDPAAKVNQAAINGTTATATSDHYNAANSWTGYKTWTVSEDYSFTAKINAPGWFSPMYSNFVVVVLKDADMNDLWAFNIWGVYANHYPVADIPVTVGSDTYYIQDRNLLSPAYAEFNGNASRATMLFQWGRPFVHLWNSNYALPITSECESLEYSAANWMHILAYGSATNHMDWYLPERHDDFWGNANEGSHPNSSDGAKSIFDPCPKGYRVISPKVAEAIASGIEFATTTVGTNTHRWAKYCYDGTNYTYFPYCGLKWANSGGNPTNNYNTYGGFWTNSSYESGNVRAASCFWNADGTRQNAGQSRALSLPVRCMKDTENR